MSDQAFQPVYLLSRGGHAESLHFGALAIVAASGELLAAHGDAQVSTFLRSSAKPFQALPLVIAGGIQHYGFTSRELALICASHSGTDEHVEVAQGIQQKGGIHEDQLLCGVHPPMHRETAERLKQNGIPITPNRHNCSGKHSGMLAYAKIRGWDLENYIDSQHPMQQEIFALFAEIAGLPVEKLGIGVDGCSAPNWAAPLYNTALAYARLMNPFDLPEMQQMASNQVSAAMIANPDMVGGPGRFDTALMQTADGNILSKGGAEGYQGIGLRAGAMGTSSPAIGIALKISDGDARGWVAHAVSLGILRQIGVLSEAQLQKLAEFGPGRKITNWRGLEVGSGEPIFNLEIQS
jgi:L-asparaginase II